MNNKLKYISVILLLLFARGCDFYSTSLWIFQEGGLENETNPLTQFFGVGWNGLVLANIVVIILIAYCFYVYIFKYKVTQNLKLVPQTVLEYVSLLYYDQKNQFWKILYKIPRNKLAAIAHTGYIATWGIIFSSFLVTIHNLLQFYDNQYYHAYLEFVKFTSIAYYTVIVISPLFLVSVYLCRSEYKEYLNLRNNSKLNNSIEQRL